MRTPEQVKADEALSEAIVNRIRVHESMDEPFILTEYVVVYATSTIGDQEDPSYPLGIITMNGEQNPVRTVGLLDYGLIRYRKNLSEG